MKKILQIIKKLKGQLQNMSIYFSAALIPMLVSLVANPFIVSKLSPTDMAIVGYYNAFNLLFTPFVNFYLVHFYTKRYYEVNEQDRILLRATLFKTLIFFSLLLAFVAFGFLYVYTRFFNADTLLPFMPYAVLTVFSIPLTGIYSLELTDYRMQRKSKEFFKLSVWNGLLVTFMALLLVVVFQFGATGRLLSTFLAYFIVFIYLIWRNKDVFSVKFQWSIFSKSFYFCIPLVISAMLEFFSKGYDKVVLEQSGDVYTLGIYSVGATIAAHMSLFSKTINDTFQPDIFKSVVERNLQKCLKFFILKIGLMAFFVLLFVVFSPWIIKVLTLGKYTASTQFAAILSITSLTSMMFYSTNQITVALGYNYLSLINLIIGSLCSIVSFHFLSDAYGAIGVAWGSVLSFVYCFLSNIVLLSIKYKQTGFK